MRHGKSTRFPSLSERFEPGCERVHAGCRAHARTDFCTPGCCKVVVTEGRVPSIQPLQCLFRRQILKNSLLQKMEKNQRQRVSRNGSRMIHPKAHDSCAEEHPGKN